MDEVRPHGFPQGEPLAGQCGPFSPAFEQPPVERIVVYVHRGLVQAVTAPDATPVVIVYEDESVNVEAAEQISEECLRECHGRVDRALDEFDQEEQN